MARVVARKTRDELARRHTLDFMRLLWPAMQVNWHHKVLCDVCDGVLGGWITRAAVSIAPRSTKSETFSVHFPALYLGRFPQREILHISYAASLSNMFSFKVRQMIETDPVYHRLFPNTRLHPQRARLDDWRTTEGGGFRSVGVEAGISGRGADLEIIDDPLKEGDERSPATLENVWQWLLSAARTRLAPHGAIVIAATRWHPLDPIGRVLAVAKEDPNADQYEEICIPAVALPGDVWGRQAGESFWRWRYQEEELARIRAMSDRYFQALFQQNPAGTDTVDFRAENFVMRERIYEGVRGVWCFDLALSEKERSDYTSYGRWQYRRPYLFVSHLHRGREGWPDTKNQILRQMAAWPNDLFVFPKHTFELMAVQDLRAADLDYANRVLAADGLPALTSVGDRIVQVDLPGDKRARAMVFADLVAAQRVIVEDTMGGRQFVFEHANYGGLEHDDCIDQETVATHYFGIHKEFKDVYMGRGA